MKLDFEQYSNPEIEDAIDTWIHGKINREMLKSKLIDHETIERIAEKYGYSPITVQRKVKSLKSVLSGHLLSKSMS